MEEGIRLNKYIAQAGIASRREADRLIEDGRVTVNGEVATVGTKVFEGDSVKVGSKLIHASEETVVLAFYKPVGVTCTEKDEHAEVTLKDVVRFRERVTYAGRLDKDSEGLLILTNDGNLIQQMMRGENAHEKEYIVRVNKNITPDFIEKMGKGVYLKDLNKTTRPCEVKKVSNESFSIVLTQGLNRQIRRMCETLGYKVVQLKRIRVVNVTLSGLNPGEYRQLSNAEVKSLRNAVGIKEQ